MITSLIKTILWGLINIIFWLALSLLFVLMIIVVFIGTILDISGSLIDWVFKDDKKNI